MSATNEPRIITVPYPETVGPQPECQSSSKLYGSDPVFVYVPWWFDAVPPELSASLQPDHCVRVTVKNCPDGKMRGFEVTMSRHDAHRLFTDGVRMLLMALIKLELCAEPGGWDNSTPDHLRRFKERIDAKGWGKWLGNGA